MIFVSGASFSQNVLAKFSQRKAVLKGRWSLVLGFSWNVMGKVSLKKKKKGGGDGPWFSSIFERFIFKKYIKKSLNFFKNFGSGSIFTEMPKSK